MYPILGGRIHCLDQDQLPQARPIVPGQTVFGAVNQSSGLGNPFKVQSTGLSRHECLDAAPAAP